MIGPGGLAHLPIEVEAAAYATALTTGVPVFVSWDGDEWHATEEDPGVMCWVFKVPQAV